MLCAASADSFDALVAVPATTPAGLLAKLTYLQELTNEFETEFMVTEEVFVPALVEQLVYAAIVD
jgi:hypothetical protein